MEAEHTRQAQIEALKSEREGLVQRSERDDRKDHADARIAEIDNVLDSFADKPSRAKRETAVKGATKAVRETAADVKREIKS